MISRIRLTDGRVVNLRVSEVVTSDDSGQPVAMTYEENGLILHCDVTKSDFARVCRRLGLTPPRVEIIKS
jgi:hypothetical protein